MPVEEFVRRIRDSLNADMTPAQFALFIGAGCSISSGIPGSEALVRDRWLPKLLALRSPGKNDPYPWCEEVYGISKTVMPSGAYGRVMMDLFPHAAERQQELESICSAAKPGFGYATLAQLIASSKGNLNVILTTNFDDLLADAFYLFTGVHPVVIPHGALSPYIRASSRRPLVVKVHGHHQFAPLNTPSETSDVEEELRKGVQTLLHDRGLIFIGYGGRDEGIRKLMSEMPDSSLPFGVYWVSAKEPENELSQWLCQRQAFWVQEDSFDEMMVRVRDTFGIAMPEQETFVAIFEGVVRDYVRISGEIGGKTGSTPVDNALREAAARVDETIGDWGYYEIKANRLKSQDSEAAKETYRSGLRAIPIRFPSVATSRTT